MNTCCFCGWEIDLASQSCGSCSRNIGMAQLGIKDLPISLLESVIGEKTTKNMIDFITRIVGSTKYDLRIRYDGNPITVIVYSSSDRKSDNTLVKIDGQSFAFIWKDPV